MGITLRSGKELNKKPPNVIKEVDVEIAPKQVDEKVAKNLRKSEYLKAKAVEQVNERLPLPFPQMLRKMKDDALF